MTPENPGHYDEIVVAAKWAVPNSAKPGDTFALELPKELNSLTDGFELRNSSGELIANATVKNGVVTFTLTDFVTTHKNVSGTATFTTKLNRDLEPGKPYVLKFGKVAEVTITPRNTAPVDRTSTQKYGFWIDANGNPSNVPTDRIRWTVESPIGAFDKISFEDTVGAGMKPECASIRMNGSKSLRANNEVQEWGPDLPKGTLPDLAPGTFGVKDCKEQQLSVVGPAAADGEVLRLQYDTIVTDKTVSSYQNTAAVTVNGTTQTRTVEFRRSTAGGGGEGDETTHPTSTNTATSTTTTSTNTTEPSTTAPTPGTTEPPSGTASTTVVPVSATTDAAGSDGALAKTGVNGLLVTALLGGLALVGGAGVLFTRRRSH